MTTLEFWENSQEFNTDLAHWHVPTCAPLSNVPASPNAYEIMSHGSAWKIVRHTRVVSVKSYSTSLKCEVTVPSLETHYHFFHLDRTNFDSFKRKNYVYCGTQNDLDLGFKLAQEYYEETYPELLVLDQEYVKQAAKNNKDFADSTVVSILLSIFKKGEQIQEKDCVFVQYGVSNWTSYVPPVEDMVSWELAKGEKANNEFINYLRSAEFACLHSNVRNQK